jgi:DUF1009 family protein
LETVRVAQEASVRAIAVEAGRTLLLEKEAILKEAGRFRISIIGH